MTRKTVGRRPRIQVKGKIQRSLRKKAGSRISPRSGHHVEAWMKNAGVVEVVPGRQVQKSLCIVVLGLVPVWV